MTKKTTDAEAMLRAARRSSSVIRPAPVEMLTEQVLPPAAPPAPVERRVNVGVSAALHRRLKIASAEQGISVKDLVESYLQEGLTRAGG